MQGRDKLLNHLLPSEHRQVVQAILDKAYRVIKTQQPAWTDFFEPGIISLAVPILNQLADLRVEICGGYAEAERVRIILLPAWFVAEEFDRQLGFLKIKGAKELTHRDYLGAILGLGIKREKVGDLIVDDNICQVVVAQDLLLYIEHNLVKVGNVTVMAAEIDEEQLTVPQNNLSRMTTTVASLRLDAVLAAGFNLARDKSAQFIKGEKVKLNGLINANGTAQVKKDDLISCRGKGRLKITEILGETKKGRTKLIFQKFS